MEGYFLFVDCFSVICLVWQCVFWAWYLIVSLGLAPSDNIDNIDEAFEESEISCYWGESPYGGIYDILLASDDNGDTGDGDILADWEQSRREMIISELWDITTASETAEGRKALSLLDNLDTGELEALWKEVTGLEAEMAA